MNIAFLAPVLFKSRVRHFSTETQSAIVWGGWCIVDERANKAVFVLKIFSMGVKQTQNFTLISNLMTKFRKIAQKKL